jgi:hypothetical protein
MSGVSLEVMRVPATASPPHHGLGSLVPNDGRGVAPGGDLLQLPVRILTRREPPDPYVQERAPIHAHETRRQAGGHELLVEREGAALVGEGAELNEPDLGR